MAVQAIGFLADTVFMKQDFGHRIILKALIFGLVEMLAAGVLVAVIYKPKEPAKA